MIRCRCPSGSRTAGQGDVDPVALQAVHQLVGLERGMPALERLFQLLLDQVAEPPYARPFRHRQLGDAAQEGGQRRLPPEKAHPRLFQRVEVGRRLYGSHALLVDRLQVGAFDLLE